MNATTFNFSMISMMPEHSVPVVSPRHIEVEGGRFEEGVTSDF